MSLINIDQIDIRTKVTRSIPFIPDAWVTYYDDVKMSHIESLKNKQSSEDDNIQMLADQIADWNLANNEGKLPITVETIKTLPSVKLIRFLFEEFRSVLEESTKQYQEEKKTESKAIDNSPANEVYEVTV